MHECFTGVWIAYGKKLKTKKKKNAYVLPLSIN